MFLKNLIHGLVIVVIVIGLSSVGIKYTASYFQPDKVVSPQPLTPAPTIDETFRTYSAPAIADKDVYKIVLVGDSMTHALGPHGGTFSEFMNAKYKPHNKAIIIDNYAAGSTSILTILDAMNKKTTYWDSTFEPLLSREFDLILIESFGYNPLSQFPLEEGLKKQEEKLEETMKILLKTRPEARIAFVATIAPSKTKYAAAINPDTTILERTAQAEERAVYIKNHIKYANEHNIPVINIYEKSLTETGDGNLAYINPSDYIHPSFAGVDFIGQEITNYLYENQVLPH